MPSGSRIINVSSIASKWGNPATPFYCAAKAAQDSLTHTWAFEVRIPDPRRVRAPFFALTRC